MNFIIVTKNEIREDYLISAESAEKAIKAFHEGQSLFPIHAETINTEIMEVTIEKEE